jgi:hypothetical protein
MSSSPTSTLLQRQYSLNSAALGLTCGTTKLEMVFQVPGYRRSLPCLYHSRRRAALQSALQGSGWFDTCCRIGRVEQLVVPALEDA